MSEHILNPTREDWPTTQTITIPIPANEWITSNDRYTRYPKAGRTKALRYRAMLLARQQLQPMTGPVHVAVTTWYRGGRGLDADAAAPAVKACLDGIVDAGILADDDGKHVVAITYLRSRRDAALAEGFHALTITLTDQHVPWLDQMKETAP